MMAQSVPARWERAEGVGGTFSIRPLPCGQGGTEVVQDPSYGGMLPTVLCTGGCAAVLSHRVKNPSPSLT